MPDSSPVYTVQDLPDRRQITGVSVSAPQVLNLAVCRIRYGRADRDNAIDVYIGDEYDGCTSQMGEWQKHFKVKPPVFTREEKRAWLDRNTDVTLGSDAFFPFWR